MPPLQHNILLEQINKSIDRILDSLEAIDDKINTHDTEIALIKKQLDGDSNKIKIIIDYFLKACWAIIMCYICWKLKVEPFVP